MPLGFLGSQGDSDLYRINRSLRFNSADSAYLNRTFGTATTQNKFTLSLWVKLGLLGTPARNILAVSTNHTFGFTTGNVLNLTFGGTSAISTTGIFRDPSAWYHIVWTQDVNAHTIYVNGASVGTATATSSVFNTAVSHQIGAENTTTRTNYFNGYMTEIIFVDGQALTPSNFAETDSITGRWKAKAYTGTYGSNGFYLNFSDNSGTTSTTLGKDSSGNGNNWTPNAFSVSTGVGNDSLLDSPTNAGASGNFCTWSSIISGSTPSNGNLDVINSTARGTQALLQYNAYWEITSTGGITTAGIVSDGGATNTTTIASGKTYGFRLTTAGALDYINITDAGAWVSIATGITGVVFPYASAPSSTTASLNAGQRDWAGSVPSGYKEIETANIPAPVIQKPSRHVDAVIYTGTGSAFSPTSSLDFPPDMVWIKSRSANTDFSFYDSTRGAEKRLEANTDDEVTADGGVTSFNAQGFSVGTLAQVNTSTATYISWNWRKAAVCGFDIVSYTGNGSNRTISHGLGAVPRMMLVKARTTASFDQGWAMYHASTSATPQNEYLPFESTGGLTASSTVWNNTAPTSSVFSVGTSSLVNTNNDTYIAYLFAQIEGYSRFGSYTGTGSADGPFVWCGFRPRIVFFRILGSGNSVRIYDGARNTTNVTSNAVLTSSTSGDTSGVLVDFLSNGIKIRDIGGSVNSSSTTYLFAAFANSPFKYARAR